MRERIKKVIRLIKEQSTWKSPNPQLVGKLINFTLRRPFMKPKECKNIFKNYGVNDHDYIFPETIHLRGSMFKEEFSSTPKYFYIVNLTRIYQFSETHNHVFCTNPIYYVFSTEDIMQTIYNLKGKPLHTEIEEMGNTRFYFLYELFKTSGEIEEYKEKYEVNKKLFDGMVLECKVLFFCEI
jgi:hypothetical protein